MDDFGSLRFRPFEESDVAVFTPLMKRAFDDDTQRHLGEAVGGPPGYDNGDFLRNYALHQASTAFAVYHEQEPLGVVIVWIRPDDENFLGCLFVDPDFGGRGFGLAIWRFVEARFPQTRVWRTETPGFSTSNHAFYVNKCGFHIVKIEHARDRREASYLMEKQMNK